MQIKMMERIARKRLQRIEAPGHVQLTWLLKPAAGRCHAEAAKARNKLLSIEDESPGHVPVLMMQIVGQEC